MKKSTGLRSQLEKTAPLFAEAPATPTTATPARRNITKAAKAATPETAPGTAPLLLRYGKNSVQVWPVLECHDLGAHCALFRDDTGQVFYIAKTPGEVTPQSVEKCDAPTALAWVIGRTLAGFLEERLISRCVAGAFWQSQHHGFDGLSRHIGRALNRNLRAVAIENQRTPLEQIRVFIEQGLAENVTLKKAQNWARRKGLDTSRGVQLELATGLVEVVRTLETDPSKDLLARAQKAAAQLQQSLTAEAAPLAAVG